MVASMRCALVVLAMGLVSCEVTPVEKVIELLSKLSSQIAAEGKVEAAQYDKYACFCKDEADGKTYAIEKSEKKIRHLDAVIDKLDSDISDLDKDIAALSEHITGLEGLIKAAEEQRAIEHGRYKGHNADITAAIEATAGAIDALKNAKAGQAGDVKLNLAQLQVLGVRVLGSDKQLDALTVLTKASGPGKSHRYEYQSNDIIATLQGLLVTFKASKADLDKDEFDSDAAFERKRLGLQNEKKFAAKDKAEKEARVEALTEELNVATDDRTAETKMKESDEAFRAELENECELKARMWDQRSSARSEELTAISEALTSLKNKVSGNYAANKKLVGLQRGAGHKSASFLQVSSSRHESTGVAAVKKAVQFLQNSARQMGSPVLAAVVLKSLVQADHFEKVRSLIKDLISRLVADAESEATQKTECDTNMKHAITERDSSQETIEAKTAAISGKNAAVAQLTAEIATLKAEVAANLKALSEATELEAEQIKAYEKTQEESHEGVEGVTFALSVLREFYGDSLVQTSFVPAGADREGKTVGDRAPEVFGSSEYHGKGAASKGIIGILEVILSDFERTIEQTDDERQASQEEFVQLESDIKGENEAMNKNVISKEVSVTENNDDIVALKKEKKAAEGGHSRANDELEKLQALCVEGEETYAQRVAARKKEIDALKEAINILEEWQN